MENNFKNFAENLAHQAGEIMRKNFKLGMDKEWKGDHTPVTETDKIINALVLEEVKKNFPTHSVLSEEGNSILENSEYVWVCDPVDGTHNFSHGIPTSTFLLTLTKNGMPILSIVYDPFMDRLFFAEKGKGAFMNGDPIKVSKSENVKATVIGVGKWNKTINLFPVGQELNKRGVRLISGLSVGYMGALVAIGEMSALVFGGNDPHDTSAIQLLVEEAGGKATDLFGKNTRYDQDVEGQLATNGLVHDEILDIIKNFAK